MSASPILLCALCSVQTISCSVNFYCVCHSVSTVQLFNICTVVHTCVFISFLSSAKYWTHTGSPRELFHFGCGSPWPPFMWDDGSPKYPLKAHAIQDPTNLQYKSCIAVGQAIITLFSQVELEIVFGFKQDFFLAQIWLQNLLKNQPILAKKEAKTHLIQE